ncbi:hypothetical protein DL98DRAFT_522328 [Cadophora sp. DSE1049]|nr:hypothetical protein DL98DRAFT_522328 [Cadophora sp. DSE1049]
MYEARATAYLTRRMSQIASDSPQRGLSTDASSDARQSTTEDIISKEQALDALSFRGSDNKKDIDDCLKYAEISGHEKAQLAVLTREDAFQDWLKEDRRSSALVIHGNLDDDENTPISYLAAQIGEKYRKKRGYIVLSWFCGLNTDENGAAIMARLTGQLLSQATRLLPPEDFNFISRHEYKKLKQRDLKMLISAFSNTIQKLRSKRIVVFCLIDSISTYETGNLRKDTEKLVLFFRSLVRSTRRRSREDMKHELIFKLLISDGQSSELAIKYFKDREIMEIDDEADTDVDSDASLVNSD